MRPQYHFFYGSTADEKEDESRTSTMDHRLSQNEHESLIGESLVPTDNEEEAPHITDYDLQHVLISNGNGMRHVVGGGTSSGSNGKVPHLNGAHRENGNGGPSINKSSSGENSKPSHSAAHVVGLVGCTIVCVVVLAVTLFPNWSKATAGSIGMPAESFVVNFKTVDRSKSSDPVKLFLRTDLFHQELLYKGNDPIRVFQFPFPTGAFWTNLVLTSSNGHGPSDPVAVYPYAYKWTDTSMVASYPALHREEDSKAIHDYFVPDLTFESNEHAQQRYVTSFGPLSVTLQFRTTSSSSTGKASSLEKGSWQSFLVQGSPYITLEYNYVSPRIKALSTFNDVMCPEEVGMKDVDFDDNFSDDDDDNGTSRRMRSRRRLLGVCGVTEDSGGSGLTALRGVQFVLQTQEGVNWIMFSSEPMTFVFDPKIRKGVVSSKPFKGTLRLAVIPPSSKVESSDSGKAKISSSTGFRRLVYHASVYPVDATVDYVFRDPTAVTTTKVGKNALSGILGSAILTEGAKNRLTPKKARRVAEIRFHFTTRTTSSAVATANVDTGKTTGLLMLSLPHHVFSFTKSHILDAKHFDLVYQCIKGAMTPVVGSLWSYEEELLSLGFEPSTEDASESLKLILSNKNVRKLMVDNLEIDEKIAPPAIDENIYGFGKQAARLAQLAHIADEILGPDHPTTLAANTNATHTNDISHLGSSRRVGDRLIALRQNSMDKLSRHLELLFTDQLDDSLVYDASLGGLVSSNGLSDFNADFGNGRYNDHHFHYGYLLYASAILGKLNSTFVLQHGDRVDALMHDVAYNAKIKDGSFFPLARHMSWFDGHSFASGLFPFSNGKSQESSSEAVNCYYGAYLWSLVRSGSAYQPNGDTSPSTDFARLLLAMEVRGAKTYWHMMPPLASSPGTQNSTIDAHPELTVYSPNFAKNFMVGNLGMLDAICSTWFGTENLYVHMINFLPVTAITRYLFNSEYVKNEYANVISNYLDVEMAWRGYVVSDHALVAPMKAWEEALELKSTELDAGLSKSQVLYFILTSPKGFDVSVLATVTSSSHGDESIPGDNNDFNNGHLDATAQSGGASSAEEDASCSNHPACAATGMGGLCCPTAAGSDLFCCHV